MAFCLPESCSLWSDVVEWKQQLPDLCIDVELVPVKLCHVALLRHSKDICFIDTVLSTFSGS